MYSPPIHCLFTPLTFFCCVEGSFLVWCNPLSIFTFISSGFGIQKSLRKLACNSILLFQSLDWYWTEPCCDFYNMPRYLNYKLYHEMFRNAPLSEGGQGSLVPYFLDFWYKTFKWEIQRTLKSGDLTQRDAWECKRRNGEQSMALPFLESLRLLPCCWIYFL